MLPVGLKFYMVVTEASKKKEKYATLSQNIKTTTPKIIFAVKMSINRAYL